MQYNELENSIANKSEESNFFRYALIVEYIGSSFAGSQKQPNQKTVQSELEAALNVLAKLKVKTFFSGRTDTGVNAKGQVVHFDLPFKIDEYRFVYALNSILPSDISISSIKQVDLRFHSQKNALFRWYRYIINNRPQRSVWLNNALHIHEKLNISEMSKALGYIVGKHDFSAFKNASSNNPATECIVYCAECKAKEGIVFIDLIANRFLYNMVRIIVGTLVNIGKGISSAEHMLEVLSSKDRTKAGPTAKPEGLTFMLVGYNNSKKYDFSELLNKEALYNGNLFCQAW